MPVQDDDGAGIEDGIHGSSLRGAEADGEEALPVAPGKRAAGTKLVEGSNREMDDLKGGSPIHVRGVESGCLGNEGYDGCVFSNGLNRAAMHFR